ncbi:T-lymphocyte activation antigen CD80 isoform X3 [Manis pentadactyla]|uniref:T-lymphocyte activation antigen CD80 isoform X3 n=1 Tax=Manis pentadactyla TaxID=143292 RepID=UPI00255D0B21|nr:T-lymphocyte activation antigen CD80 isoform X3 [Manis pentadactyla]KAI5134996.1 T-Lymphocyte Activation Antigen Cd80 [Manis pentadactyla]
MGPALKWRTPPPRCPYLRLSHLVVLAALFSFCSGTIQVTKTVKEMVVLSCDYNISTDELTTVRIYWQKDNEMVLAVMSGKVTVWPEYENRTLYDIPNNVSIMILALRLSDNGTYTCVIQKTEKGSYKVEHLTSVMLFVRADFPIPSITDLGNPSPTIKRIICATSGGFPEPHLSWLENGEEVNAINTTVSQDPETKLYTISSELDFNVTTNHSFICLVKYGDLTVSQTFNWKKSEAHSSEAQFPLWAILLILLSGVFVIGSCLAHRPVARWRRRRDGKSMEMERISPIYTACAEKAG